MKTKAETWQEKDMPLTPFSSFEAREDGDGIPRPFRPEGGIHARYPKELKFHVTMEALREKIPQGELGAMYGVPQTLISIWKKAAVEAIRSNIHYKPRKRREALAPIPDQASEDESLPMTPTGTAQQFCEVLRAAARRIERDPAILEHLVGQGSAD